MRQIQEATSGQLLWSGTMQAFLRKDTALSYPSAKRVLLPQDTRALGQARPGSQLRSFTGQTGTNSDLPCRRIRGKTTAPGGHQKPFRPHHCKGEAGHPPWSWSIRNYRYPYYLPQLFRLITDLLQENSSMGSIGQAASDMVMNCLALVSL